MYHFCWSIGLLFVLGFKLIEMIVATADSYKVNKHIVPSCRWKSFGISSQPRFANNKFDGAAVWRLRRVTCGKLDVSVDILKKKTAGFNREKTRFKLFIGGSNTKI